MQQKYCSHQCFGTFPNPVRVGNQSSHLLLRDLNMRIVNGNGECDHKIHLLPLCPSRSLLVEHIRSPEKDLEICLLEYHLNLVVHTLFCHVLSRIADGAGFHHCSVINGSIFTLKKGCMMSRTQMTTLATRKLNPRKIATT